MKGGFPHSQQIESLRSRFLVILQSTRKRGRPIGTGIDDSDRIARLSELLRIHPDLKPTTAIRIMGFSDPSAIRRLRDKYKLMLHASGAIAASPMPVLAPIGTSLPDTKADLATRPMR